MLSQHVVGEPQEEFLTPTRQRLSLRRYQSCLPEPWYPTLTKQSIPLTPAVAAEKPESQREQVTGYN